MTVAQFCMGLIAATAPMMASGGREQVHGVEGLHLTFRRDLWVSVILSSLAWIMLLQRAPVPRMLGHNDDLAMLVDRYVGVWKRSMLSDLELFPISLHHILRRRSRLRIHGVSRSG